MITMRNLVISLATLAVSGLVLLSNFVVGVLVLMYGWGLQPVNWWWVIFSAVWGFVTLGIVTIVQVIYKNMKGGK